MIAVQNFEKKRWVCMAAALIACVCAGFGYAWSVLQNPIVSTHGWADNQVSLAYTLTVVCSTMAPLFLGAVIRKLGSRRCVAVGAVLFGCGLFLTGSITALWQLYLYYGLLNGIGVGFIYPSMMAYVVRLFPDRSGMASGMGTAAYGAGAILWAPAAVAIMERASLAAALRVLGIALGGVILAASFLLGEPPEEFERRFAPIPQAGAADNSKDLRRGEMVKRPAFYLMVAIFACALVAGTIVISQASPILQQTLGYSTAQAAAMVSVVSACNVGGRFLIGTLSDRKGLGFALTLTFCCCAVAMAVLALSGIEAVVLVCMGVAAACYGGFASTLTPLTAKMFGRRYITENYGVIYVVFGISALIGPNLAVSFKNAAGGSYSGAFLTAAALAVAGLIGSRFLKSNAR